MFLNPYVKKFVITDDRRGVNTTFLHSGKKKTKNLTLIILKNLKIKSFI